jgi:hypothetical protein
MTTTNLSKDEALDLFRMYYNLVHPEELCAYTQLCQRHECPGCPNILVDYNVKLQDSISSRGKPMIQATLRVGYLELKRVVPGYRLSKCPRNLSKTCKKPWRSILCAIIIKRRPDGRSVLWTSKNSLSLSNKQNKQKYN